MKILSRCLILIFLAMIIFTMPVMAKSSPIKVFVNGKILYDVFPVMENSRILVPIRFISEELGFDVEYIKSSGAVKIKKDDINIEIKMDSNKAKADNKEVELDVKPFIKENEIFVPLRFISESLGEEISWDGKNKIVLVGKHKGEFNTENTFLYTNEEYGYTLNFPNAWKEEAIIETRDGVLYVYDKKSAERFKSDGVENFGPVFEIRYSDYPVIATVPYDTNYILHYENGNYIESIFVLDFQYYPDTKDSYIKLWNEGQEVLGSFKKLGDIKLIDKEIDFLSAAKQGKLNGIEIPLGTSRQDLLNILGEPDEIGKVTAPYLKYADTTFYLKDDVVNVIGVKIELPADKIKELLGTPDLDGMSDAGTTEYIVGYDVDPYYLFFRYSSKEAETGRLTFKNPMRIMDNRMIWE